jgi:hypothetical protein
MLETNTNRTSSAFLLRASHLFAAAALGLAACEGCRSNGTPPQPPVVAADAGTPTLRLYVVSNLAGALEPCGCTKDQLGGVDHLAAFVAQERAKAPASLLVAAGPTFFMDPVLKGDRTEQDKTKAETIARTLRGLDFAAFAPGENCWAAGKASLLSYASMGGASLLLANAPPPVDATDWKRWSVREVNGVKVGFVGVGPAPKDEPGASLDPQQAAREGIDAVKKEGAKVIVVLAAVGRGEAKRIADVAPEVTAVVVGAKTMSGDLNVPAPPAERIGDVLIIESANHLQSVAVLDLYVRDGGYKFADATGIERAAKREELTHRIDDLRIKISNWERDKKIAAADLDARKADLTRLQQERDALDVQPPPEKGSFFRYTAKQMVPKLGSEPNAQAVMLAYYKKVNERNKELFKDRLPRPVDATQASYVGVQACGTCHESQKKFWDGTAHAHAYATLSTQFKEFNLECVSCHVTGYDEPGGSTVTHAAKLENVQCETCHGPGSKHAATPKDRSLITRYPRAQLCIGCHHPPHVEQFDASLKMADIVGPGHGKPLK